MSSSPETQYSKPNLMATKLQQKPKQSLKPTNIHKTKCNKHLMSCEAQLAWKCLFTPTFLGGRFGKHSRFISRSVHARLQVSACSSYDLFQPG